MAVVANYVDSADVRRSMRYVRQTVCLRQDKWAYPWKENSFFVPLPCRRAASVLSEFVPLTPFRSRSARPAPFTAPSTPGHGMQRPQHQPLPHQQQHNNNNNHNQGVSVAKLYDWTPEHAQDREETLSVSKLYQEIAGGGVSVSRSFSDKGRSRVGQAMVSGGGGVSTPLGVGPAGGGNRLNPGRMFLRDKGMLTKGEREIIEGIYRNRGDLKRDVPGHGYRSEFYVRSHHDAWLVGKPGLPGNKPSTEIPREFAPRDGLLEVMVPANTLSESGPQESGELSGSAEWSYHQQGAKVPCIMCLREQQLQQQQKLQQQQQQLHNDIGSSNNNHHHRTSPQQRRNGGHLVLQRERGHHLQHPSIQGPLLSSNLILRPINVNDSFRPNGEEGPSAPPASPTSKVFLSSQFPPPAPPPPLAASPSSSFASPTSSTHKLLGRRQEPTHADGHHARGEDAVAGQSDSEESIILDSEGNVTGTRKRGKKKKVQVKVVLPQVAADPADDVEVKGHQHNDPLATVVMQGRPALSRSERHLSHSDIKLEKPAPRKSQAATPRNGPSPSQGHPIRNTQPEERHGGHGLREERHHGHDLGEQGPHSLHDRGHFNDCDQNGGEGCRARSAEGKENKTYQSLSPEQNGLSNRHDSCACGDENDRELCSSGQTGRRSPRSSRSPRSPRSEPEGRKKQPLRANPVTITLADDNGYDNGRVGARIHDE